MEGAAARRTRLRSRPSSWGFRRAGRQISRSSSKQQFHLQVQQLQRSRRRRSLLQLMPLRLLRLPPAGLDFVAFPGSTPAQLDEYRAYQGI